MRRSDGTAIAIGGILFGIGAVTLGLLSHTAAGIIGAVCMALGFYVIVGGVYLGCWTPATALERAFQPELQDAEVEVFRVEGQYVYFQVAVKNGGRDDLNGAHLNVIVPCFVSEMHRCTVEGEIDRDERKGAFFRREGHERFWDGNVSFPGRETRLMFFRITMPSPQDFSVTLKVHSPALRAVPWMAGFEISVPGHP